MRYRCTSCKEIFEVPEGDRPRCPKCLRIHDVVPLERPSPKISRYRGPIAFFSIIAVGIGAYVAWVVYEGREQPEASGGEEAERVAVGPMEPDELRRVMSQRHLEKAEQVLPFEGSPAVEDFARKAAHGQAGSHEKAQALLKAIQNLLDEHHEVYASISPRTLEPQTPAETLRRLQASERFEPYPYEVAALMVTACRAVGVPAVLAEVYQYESTARPTDASGTQGHYVAAVPRGDGRTYQRPTLYDPATGRSGQSADGQNDVLTDLEAASARLSLQGLHLASAASDLQRAERLCTLAVRLRPGSATALAARGTVRLLSGSSQLSANAALEDYEQALRQRPDAQRKILVARVLLALGQGQRAEELVRSALSDSPEFGAAHGLLGLILAAQESFEEARAELTQAERLEPRDPQLQLLWVQYYVAQRETQAAIEAARAVIERIPDDPQPRLLLAQVLYQDAQYEAAEAQLREVVRRNPDNTQLRELLEEMFEFDADEAGQEEAEADAGAEDDAAVAEVEVDGGGDAGDEGLRLQMGKGLGKIRLGGPDGFQLAPVGP